MSGIVGIHSRVGRPISRADVERLTAVLAHRGPDGARQWSDGPIGLGHLMLRTTPESDHEQLPLVGGDGRVVLTADARLDNRAELIDALGLAGRPVAEIADGALILGAYLRWGEDCPAHLLGDFAFAIWDARTRQLFCARDHFGVKPFYYHASPELFAFASEVKALFELGDVPRDLNEARIVDFLVGLDDTSITFYRDILRLPPGHAMTIRADATRCWAYWTLDRSRELRLGSDEEYAAAFRERFTEAVRCRMRSASAIGSMLSGGLDSSSITCTARDLLGPSGGHKLHTFSAVFGANAPCDESAFQQIVLARDGLEPHTFLASEAGPLADFERVLWHQDEAYKAGNLYIDWGLYGVARDHGVRVILDGFDGDSTVSRGDGYLTELASSGQWLGLAREVKAYADRLHEPWLDAYWSWVWHYGLNPTLSRSRIYRRGRRVVGAIERRLGRSAGSDAGEAVWRRMLNADFSRRSGLDARLRAHAGHPSTAREQHYLRLTHPGMPTTLELMDRAAAAFAVELRFPFWDRRLVEFCLALPPEQKLKGGWNRIVMRRAMAGVLPDQIRWRGSKMDMHPSFERGLRDHGRRQLDEVILKDSGIFGQYVHLPTLRDVYRRFISQMATVEEVNAMWRAASLGLWLNRVTA